MEDEPTLMHATVLEHDFGFMPKIPLRQGLQKFAEWYRILRIGNILGGGMEVYT